MAGLFLWLMGYRLIAVKRGDRRLPLPAITVLGLGAAALTAGGETTYFGLKTGVDPVRMLAVSLSLQTGVRPGMVVFATAATLAVIGAARQRWSARPGARRERGRPLEPERQS